MRRLFSFRDKVEGEGIPDAFLSVGRKLDTSKNGLVYNGYYLAIRLPFSKVRKMTNPCTFVDEEVSSHNVLYFFCRRIRNVGKMRFYSSHCYVPDNGWQT